MKTAIITAIAAMTLASCATAGDYATLSKGEYQIAGHPYKTAKNCERTAPIGKFDRECDIPLLGYRGFSDPSMTMPGGSIGGGGLGL